MRRLVAVYVVLVMIIGFSGDLGGGEPEGGPDAEYRYSVNMQTIRADFNSTGEIIIPKPEGGSLTITGQTITIRAGSNYSVVNPDGSFSVRPDHSIPVSGTVDGHPASEATLLLGDFGIYGIIKTCDAEYLIDPDYIEALEIFEQVVEMRSIELSLEQSSCLAIDPGCTGQVPAPQGCDWPCPEVQSYVQVDVDGRLRAIQPDWKDRAASAFTGHHGSWEMWKDICLELLMQDDTPRGIPDIGSHTEIGEALDGYTDYLEDDHTTDASAYHLWTDRDLYGCPDHNPFPCPGDEDNNVIGAAVLDTAVLVPLGDEAAQVKAVSVNEGKDIRSTDYYDPDKKWHRARLSGHELSHTYGAPHHNGCKSSNNCNIVRPILSSAVNTYWTDESRCEVYRWYFHDDDEYEAGEPCPDWYQP